MSLSEYKKMLAVCTGNICRSPMAEGILRHMFQSERFTTVLSAGTHALSGNPAADFAILASCENGIDISGHCARQLDDTLIKSSNVILCMEPSHVEWILTLDSGAAEKVYSLADFSCGTGSRELISDPYGCSLREYRECFRVIDECLRKFVSKSALSQASS